MTPRACVSFAAYLVSGVASCASDAKPPAASLYSADTSASPNCETSASALPESQLSVVSATTDAADAPNILDGNPDTRWTVIGFPQDVVIQLGGSYAVSGLLYQETWTRIGNYDIYVSTDGSNWGAPISSGTMPSNGTISFPPTTGTYLMLTVLGGNDGYCFVDDVQIVASSTVCSEPDSGVPDLPDAGVPDAGGVAAIGSNSGIMWGVNGHPEQGGPYVALSPTQQGDVVLGAGLEAYRVDLWDDATCCSGTQILSTWVPQAEALGFHILPILLPFPGPSLEAYPTEEIAYQAGFSMGQTYALQFPQITVWELGNEYDALAILDGTIAPPR
jgi:F5/8 type C domain